MPLIGGASEDIAVRDTLYKVATKQYETQAIDLQDLSADRQGPSIAGR
jgi:hypothetical protein